MSELNENNNWMSFSDLMTGLMVIFMFIAISYMIKLDEKQKERDVIFEEFKATQDSLYADLKKEFKDDFQQWDVQLDKDLSIKFTNPDILFESGMDNIKPNFQIILNSFLPRYFNVLLQEKYENDIIEVRMEGHTDEVPAPQYDSDPYIGNVILSQLRATSVMRYFRSMPYFDSLSNVKKRRLQSWLTVNGLSYGRTLDSRGNLTFESKQPIDNIKSRRVEFRIMTSSKKLVNDVIERIKKNE